MNIIRTAIELRPGGRKVCLAVGFFDGVHLGHQQVIRQTLADAAQHEALGLVVTFDRHPNTVVAPGRVPPLIYSLPQKLRVIQSLGVEHLLLIRFDKAFSAVPGQAFIRGLAADLGQIHSLCVGDAFAFGHKRDGNVALLRQLGLELRFIVHGMAAVALDGKTVSSTRIRQAVQTGDLDGAGQMLGRAYSIAGTVLAGDKLGRQLGFPTANIDTAGLVLPPNGVYAAHARTGGRTFRSAVNIGVRPTVAHGGDAPRVEAHLLDFDGDLYGQEVELTFVEQLRSEQKFPSLEALKARIAEDVAEARRRF